MCTAAPWAGGNQDNNDDADAKAADDDDDELIPDQYVLYLSAPPEAMVGDATAGTGRHTLCKPSDHRTLPSSPAVSPRFRLVKPALANKI